MKTRSLVLLSSVFCILFLSFPSLAQDPPMEWGEISIEDLRMSSFPADTNAAALVLGDFGETLLNNDANLNFTRHFRVKLFSSRGYDLATHSIDIFEDEGAESLEDLEAVTYVLGEDGEVTEVELDEDDVHKEELTNGWVRYVFTMPALQPGCVFEVQYEIQSDRWWLIRDWEFQYSEPSRWSEYRMKIPKNVVYAAVYQGYLPWSVQEQKEETQFFSSTAEALFGQTLVSCNAYRWVLSNAPAVRSEPYMTTKKDYINSLDLQLAHTALPSAGVRHYLSDWPTFTDQMLDDAYFGEKMEPNGDVKDKVKAITAGITSPLQKARAIYDWFTHNMTWTGITNRSTSKEPGEVLSTTTGSSAELSFLLVAMFRSAGLNADPVLISTRSDRKIQELYPILEQFNHVVVRVIAGGTYYVDGTDRSRPFHLIPTSVLNRKGFVVNKKKTEFPVLTGSQGYETKARTTLTLGDDGGASGTVEVTYGEYSALSARRTLREADKSAKTLVSSALDAQDNDLDVDSCIARNVDSLHLPLIVEGVFTGATYASQAGSLLYLNPHLPLTVSNPFTLQKRDFPVDYGAPRLVDAEVMVKLPDGYEVKELPRNRTVSAVKGSVEFSRSSTSAPGAVTVRYSLRIRKSEVLPDEYSSLREAYEQAAQACGEMIVLEKK